MDIHLSIDNPKRELPKITVGQLCSSRHFVWNAPDRFDGVWIALLRGDLHFRVDAALSPSGVWVADFKPEVVPETAETAYEVYGTDGETNELLGKGRLSVVSSVDAAHAGEPVLPNAPLTIYDEHGNAHTLSVVTLDNGDKSIKVD